MTAPVEKPFDDIRALVAGMPPADEQSAGAMREALAPFQDRIKTLGRTEPALIWLAGWQSRIDIAINRPLIAVHPCADMSKEPSLSEKDCAAAIAFGMEVVAEGADLLVLGDCGFGSATAAAGIARGLYGGQSTYWAGGKTQAGTERIDAVREGARLHSDFLSDPLEVLRRFGGRDIAGLVGASGLGDGAIKSRRRSRRTND